MKKWANWGSFCLQKFQKLKSVCCFNGQWKVENQAVLWFSVEPNVWLTVKPKRFETEVQEMPKWKINASNKANFGSTKWPVAKSDFWKLLEEFWVARFGSSKSSTENACKMVFWFCVQQLKMQSCHCWSTALSGAHFKIMESIQVPRFLWNVVPKNWNFSCFKIQKVRFQTAEIHPNHDPDQSNDCTITFLFIFEGKKKYRTRWRIQRRCISANNERIDSYSHNEHVRAPSFRLFLKFTPNNYDRRS